MMMKLMTNQCINIFVYCKHLLDIINIYDDRRKTTTTLQKSTRSHHYYSSSSSTQMEDENNINDEL
jgi:hypothetical protein